MMAFYRRLIGTAVQRLRWAAGRGKAPDFLVIGVQKGGTTSLHVHLQRHPLIEMSPHFWGPFSGPRKGNLKEVHFFDDPSVWRRGARWYRSLFNDNGKLQGEATPAYIAHPKAARRMRQVAPGAKLILALRNPVARAYSAYNHFRETGEGTLPPGLSFEEAVARELEQGPGPGSLTGRGFYIDQIERLLEHYERERLFILISEQVRAEPRAAYDRLFAFLGVPAVELAYDPAVHRRAYAEPLPPGVRQRLEALYHPYNERLYRFLGFRIPEWDASA